MTWNGLDGASILYPDQKLLLLVTPPPTATPTAAAVANPTATPPVSLAAAPQPDADVTTTPTPVAAPAGPNRSLTRDQIFWMLIIGMGGTGLTLVLYSLRKR